MSSASDMAESLLMDDQMSIQVVSDDSDISIQVEPVDIPKDRFFLGWFLFCTLGVGVLFPWNALISASDLFGLYYEGFPYEFALSIVFNVPSIIVLFLNVKLGPYFPFFIRIVCMAALDGVGLILIAGITIAPIDMYIRICASMLVCFCMGCATAIFFGASVGFGAHFPPKYMGAYMTGNGVAGIIVCVLRLITSPDVFPILIKDYGLDNVFPFRLVHTSPLNHLYDPRISAFIYFGVAVIVLLASALSYLIIVRLPFAKHYLTRQIIPNAPSQMAKKPVRYVQVIKKIWIECVDVVAIFFFTLLIFPGFTLQIYKDSPMKGIFLICSFQLFDFVGRILTKWIKRIPPWIMPFPVFGRLVFIGLFLAAVVFPDIFALYYLPFFYMFLFATSNGFLGTLTMMYGPSKVDDHERETAGLILSFLLNTGIFTGVFLAVPVLMIINGPCNAIGLSNCS